MNTISNEEFLRELAARPPGSLVTLARWTEYTWAFTGGSFGDWATPRMALLRSAPVEDPRYAYLAAEQARKNAAGSLSFVSRALMNAPVVCDSATALYLQQALTESISGSINLGSPMWRWTSAQCARDAAECAATGDTVGALGHLEEIIRWTLRARGTYWETLRALRVEMLDKFIGYEST